MKSARKKTENITTIIKNITTVLSFTVSYYYRVPYFFSRGIKTEVGTTIVLLPPHIIDVSR